MAQQADRFDTTPTVPAGARPDQPALPVPERVGVYRLLRVLGQGGMGTVYLAEQDEPIKRQVALKVVKQGMDTREVIRRFESERQSLALMSHPNIARVLDAGSTESGRPYFVMELVAGLPFVDFCDEKKFDVRDRIRLFIEVCSAVHHAHQKGIIHRDLKPNNILVSLEEGKAIPKVIDFGIAKAVDSRVQGQTAFTELGSAIGTPEYMSPEQAQGALDIDTQSDIYTLGVILYETLVGALPVDPTSLMAAPGSERLQALTQAIAPRPSARLRHLSAEAAANVAGQRQTDPAALERQLKGDLDWIVLKAMDKVRSRRYASASELAADLERYLRNQPVIARSPSMGYRLRLLVRRHRTAAVAAALVVFTLLLGAAGTVLEMVRARRAEAAARVATSAAVREAAKAKAVNDFLKDLLSAPDTKQQGRDVKVVDALGKAAARLETAHTLAPEIEAAVRDTLGTTYQNLGNLKEAEKQISAGLELRRRVMGPEDRDTLTSLSNLAELYHDQGRMEEAETLDRRTLEVRRRVLGPEHAETTITMNDLAAVLFALGKQDEAEGLIRQAADIRERTLGPKDSRTLVAKSNYGALLGAEGKLKEAEPILAQVLESQKQVVGPDHSNTLFTLKALAGVFQDEKKLDEAERAYREAFTASVRVSGPEQIDTLVTENDFATLLKDRGKFSEAEAHLRHALAGVRTTLPKDHLFNAYFERNLGSCLSKERKFPEAEQLLLDAQSRFVSTAKGKRTQQVEQSRRQLAALYEAWGKKDKAAQFSQPQS
jgi:serine/threonine protein kinase/Tfp pilus assembly protein PilF